MARPISSSGAEVPPVLPSIPLSPEPPRPTADQSIGELVREVATNLSALVRSEVELARVEVTREVRKGLQGSVFFVIALVILLFSLFFFFFALGEMFADLGFHRSVAFGMVFGIMLVVAALFGLLGFRRVRRIRKPERTISTLKDSAAVFSGRGRPELGHGGDGHLAR